MNRLAKTALMASVAFGVITTAAHAQDGVAQDPAAGDAVDDIIVTARRTEESLQTTPLAVSASGRPDQSQLQVGAHRSWWGRHSATTCKPLESTSPAPGWLRGCGRCHRV